MVELSKLDVLVAGQVITSRTETIEEYLREKTKSLGVIGIPSPYAAKNFGRCSLYEKGKLSQQFSLPIIKLKGPYWFTQPLLLVVFCTYFIFMVIAALRLRKKFDIFIGVACFSMLVGLFLKKIGLVKHLIYYTIDYYPLPKNFCFNTLINRSIWILDKICVKVADLTWHISERIKEARFRFAGVIENSYRHIVVPLCYNAKLLRFVPIEKIEKNTIGFVGTLTENQGLQLLITAMPSIIKEIPEVKIRIIGKGPYENRLKAMVKSANLGRHFIFHGFVEDEKAVLDILSHCAIGIAPWTSAEDDNVLYADPGKPKLYAFCSLPIIITNGALIAKEINEREAGININYDKQELTDAIIRLLRDKDRLKRYKDNSRKFAQDYTSDKVLNAVLQETLNILN